jgi:hypothetical protein
MKSKNKILLFIVLLITSVCFGESPQDSLDKTHTNPSKSTPPIPVELFATNKALNFQMIISRQVPESRKLGFFGLNYVKADYKNDRSANEFVMQAFLTYNIYRGFSINSGMTMNHFYGFRPSAGLQYIFANPKLLIVIIPRFDLTETRNFEALGLVEFKPKWNRNWGLYSRLQGLYNYDVRSDFHSRSYIYARLGVSYKKYSSGIGANMDWYGPSELNKNTFGFYIRTELF